jgi:hypothetical protein
MVLGCRHPKEDAPSNRPWYQINDETILFTQNAQCKTVFYAMPYWLTSEKARKGIWGEISRKYWMMEGGKVLRALKEAAGSNKLLRGYDLTVVDPHEQGKGKGRDLIRMLEKALE